MSKKSWFEVDKTGLGKILARRGPEFVVFELVQNAWDEKTSNVNVLLRSEGPRRVRLTVEDDNPNGFEDLRHAFTLFAESGKKGDPGKRGRFNLGEKLVLALALQARVSTTCGEVVFDETGRSLSFRRRRKSGSEVDVLLPMTRTERVRVERAVSRLIPPAEITTVFNGVILSQREPVAKFKAGLATEVADAEGRLKKTVRQTRVTVYAPDGDETGTLYEMGIPVVETGDRWHYDVAQASCCRGAEIRPAIQDRLRCDPPAHDTARSETETSHRFHLG